MLAVAPNQRPDLETILRKQFIMRHVQRFFADIAARSEDKSSVGAGTQALSQLGDDNTNNDDTKSLKVSKREGSL